MNLCVGITIWQDGRECLERCFDSIVGVANTIVIVDGRIETIPSIGLPDYTDLEWRFDRYPNVPFHIKGRVWETNTEKVNALLEAAHIHGSEWILMLSGDEALERPEQLAEWLDNCSLDSWPIPFYFHANKPESICPTKCLRVAKWKRAVAGSNLFEHVDGTVYDVRPDQPPEPLEDAHFLLERKAVPYLSHHPELRPPGRREIRYFEFESLHDHRIPDDAGVIENWPRMTFRPHPMLPPFNPEYVEKQRTNVRRFLEDDVMSERDLYKAREEIEELLIQDGPLLWLVEAREKMRAVLGFAG